MSNILLSRFIEIRLLIVLLEVFNIRIEINIQFYLYLIKEFTLGYFNIIISINLWFFLFVLVFITKLIFILTIWKRTSYWWSQITLWYYLTWSLFFNNWLTLLFIQRTSNEWLFIINFINTCFFHLYRCIFITLWYIFRLFILFIFIEMLMFNINQSTLNNFIYWFKILISNILKNLLMFSY